MRSDATGRQIASRLLRVMFAALIGNAQVENVTVVLVLLKLLFSWLHGCCKGALITRRRTYHVITPDRSDADLFFVLTHDVSH